MRTNHSGVTEVASIRTDQQKFSDSHSRIFGEQKKFCDQCEKRFSLCECEKSEDHLEEKESDGHGN